MAYTFNPPPNWPPAPPGYTPPPGWIPGPEFPPAPPGWLWWIKDDSVSLFAPASTAMPVDIHGQSMPPTRRNSNKDSCGLPSITQRHRHVASWVWAFVPLLTFGLGTSVSFGVAAASRRTKDLTISALAYLITLILIVTIGNLIPPIGGLLFWVSIVGGTVHGIIIRARVFGLESPRNDGGDEHIDPSMERAIATVQAKRRRRGQARALVANDPALGRELHIGRPDIPRSYDDGGLVDVNHAPAEVLISALELSADLAERLIQTRDRLGGFSSLADVAEHVELPMDRYDDLEERMIFI